MPEDTIKIAIVDDHAIVRRGLGMMLQAFSEIKLIFEAENGQQLINQLSTKMPDIVLMDLEMPIMDGIESTKYLKEHYPELAIILLTMHHQDQYISYLMELGVNAYLLKHENEETLYQAIKAVYTKGFFFNDYVSQALLKRIKKRPKEVSLNHESLNQLTAREVEILRLICQDYASAEIADKLFISQRTVEGHRRNLREKIGAKGVAGMIVYAISKGIFDPEEKYTR